MSDPYVAEPAALTAAGPDMTMLRRPPRLRPHPHGVISGCGLLEAPALVLWLKVRGRSLPSDSPGVVEVSQASMSVIVATFTGPRIEAHMGKSTYEIRVAGTVFRSTP
jgi:hypothetical protein